MRCGYADGSWEFWVLILVFMFLKYVLFVFILDAIFCGTNFFIFQDSVCGYFRNLDVFNNVQFINSAGLAIIAEADLRCGEFSSEKNCRHKLVVFTSFWNWLLNVSSILTYLKYTATPFGLLMHCGYAYSSL